MKKVLAVVLAAVLFGGVAGATILGINYLGGRGQSEIAAESESASETEEETTTSINKSSSSENTGSASTDAGSVNLDVSDIVEEAMPQVVSITNTMVIEQEGYSSLFDYFYGGGSGTQEYEVPASGSGVILAKTDEELLIVTNNHVIEDSKELTVTFVDGTSVDANLKGTDSTLDIAVIAVPLENIEEDTLNNIEVAKYHDSEDLKVGQGVIAIGNALGYGQTVTVGYISALGREITAENQTYSDLIQTDAAINPGNSGGALLNMDGEVIGINVAKLSSTKVEGFGYSIPIYKVMDVIENLSTAKTKVEIDENERGRMGIYMNTISEQNAQALGIPAGVIIKGFSDEYMESYGMDSVQESPARKAGLLKNDIITAFDGQNVSSAEDLSELVSYYEKGSTVTVTYQRLENGTYTEHTAEITLGALDDPNVEPVNESDVPEKENNNGGAQLNPPQPGNGGPGGGNPGPAPKQPGDDETQEDDGQDNGSEEEETEEEKDTGDEMYELFREFLEQYQ